MVEQQRQRIEQEMTKMINDLDVGFLRKMQADMHRCAANCCENKEASLERVQRCVEKCSVKINWAQSYVQTELEQLQNKLQRCIMDCNDDVRVKLGPNPSEADVEKFTTVFENCAKGCVDKQIDYMPLLLKKIKAELVKGQSETGS
ncbi:hypothetical protein NQ315_007971 [Exocentrus adspersus]|uniref:Protein FAM136A n=1 Tax=Exocentrus adspersus TaxID=1586481 RepID=A0AAV8VFB2_9CUCU|nr:hypothetical protein NQ315_007971 [Exocentrus adspersus]